MSRPTLVIVSKDGVASTFAGLEALEKAGISTDCIIENFEEGTWLLSEILGQSEE